MGGSSFHDRQKSEWGWRFVALAVALLLASVFLVNTGILGCVPPHADSFLFRQALFLNLRDAPWPLILPNGKEMSYYLSNVLPCAAMARLLPVAWSQWCLFVWSLIPMAICLLLVVSERGGLRKNWRWLIVIVALGDLLDPFYGGALFHIGAMVGCDFSPWMDAMHRFQGVFDSPFRGCGGPYHSVPVALMAAAIMIVCRRETHVVLPVTVALLASCAPLSCLGMMPMIASVYMDRRGRRGLPWKEALLPCCMVVLLGVYFTRADGFTILRFSWQVMGVEKFLLWYARLLVAICIWVLPVWRYARHSRLFTSCVASMLILPFIFIGSDPKELEGWVWNELHLKTMPVLTFVVGYYWARYWKSLAWIKYWIVGAGLLIAAFGLWNNYRLFDRSAYLKVADLWNGHLNHDDPFLNQSVPPCREPKIPGILLRESGVSETRFPGCLIPRAPGCDYGRPPAPRR